jgi:hypothetical protein
MFSVWVALRPEDFLHWIRGKGFVFAVVVTVIFLVPITNFLPDYLSLIKTRKLVELLNRTQCVSLKIVILGVDAVLSAGFGLVTLTLLVQILSAALTMGGTPDDPNYLLDMLRAAIGISPFGGNGLSYVGLWFYATFFTSIWLWLTALGASILRFGHVMTSTRKVFAWLFKIDEKPFRAIGAVVLAIETIAFAASAVVMGIRSLAA